MSSVNLTHHFLIAMPNMADPRFSKTLTYICEHSDQGALGIVINRTTDMTVGALLNQVSIEFENKAYDTAPVYSGGPVQTDRGFVLHQPSGPWQSTLAINNEIGLTTSKDILQAVGRGEGPEQILIALGYAGWAPGQLEQELGQNAWLTVPATREVLFELPVEEKLSAAMHLLGMRVDYATLSETAGHA